MRGTTTTPLAGSFALLALIACPASHAAEVYAGIGLPGAMIGIAQPIGPALTLRADIATLGNRSVDGVEEGVDYSGRAKLVRTGVYADFFVIPGGSFRLTGGVTLNRAEIDLRGRTNNGTIEIGGTVYPVTPADEFRVRVEFPKTTPYLGIGWGHQQGTGMSFAVDLGGSIGRAKVTATASGPALSQASQADIDRETAELRDGVGKVRFLPQASFALGYRF